MNFSDGMLAATGLGLTAALLTAAWTDLQSRRVSNLVTATVLALWPFYCLAVWPDTRLASSLLLAVLTLAIGILVWLRGWLGGGDVKLLAALMLWAGPQHGLDLVLATALAGGALAVATLWYRSIGFAIIAPFAALLPRLQQHQMAAALGRQASLPYALAIVAGGLWVSAPLFLR
jgi:prepilin peptidase CpaA